MGLRSFSRSSHVHHADVAAVWFIFIHRASGEETPAPRPCTAWSAWSAGGGVYVELAGGSDEASVDAAARRARNHRQPTQCTHSSE
jgi:hypothetical protein